MLELRPKSLAITLDSALRRPQPYSSDFINAVSEAALTSLGEYGLIPTAFILRRSETLYGYELSFWMLNNTCFFRLSGQSVYVTVSNNADEAGLAIVPPVLESIYKLFENSWFKEHTVTIQSHMDFADGGGATRFAKENEQISFFGILAHLSTPHWKDQVRFVVDKSLFLENGIFVTWNSKFSNGVNRSTISSLLRVIEESFNKFGLCYNLPFKR